MTSLPPHPAKTHATRTRWTRVVSYAVLMVILIIQSALSVRLSQQAARRERVADETLRTLRRNEQTLIEMRANLQEREALLVEYQRNLQQMHALVRRDAPIVVDEPPAHE